MKQTTLILILLLCSLNGYSKNVNTEKITRISDSILLSKTDEILFRYFKISDGSFYRYLKNNNTRTEKFLSKSKIKSDNITEIWVLYSFDFPEIEGVNNGVWIKLDKNLNLIELNAQELIEIEGGKSGGWTWLAEQIIDHWDEIKSGFRDGWNAYK